MDTPDVLNPGKNPIPTPLTPVDVVVPTSKLPLESIRMRSVPDEEPGVAPVANSRLPVLLYSAADCPAVALEKKSLDETIEEFNDSPRLIPLAPVDLTVKAASGELVPIPTLPEESIRIRSVPLVATPTVSAAG